MRDRLLPFSARYASSAGVPSLSQQGTVRPTCRRHAPPGQRARSADGPKQREAADGASICPVHAAALHVRARRGDPFQPVAERSKLVHRHGAQRGTDLRKGPRLGRRRLAKRLAAIGRTRLARSTALWTIRDDLSEAPNHARPCYRNEAGAIAATRGRRVPGPGEAIAASAFQRTVALHGKQEYWWRLGLGAGAARPILAAPGMLNYPLFAAFSKAADGRLRRWVYGRCSLCLSPRRGDFFRLRHSVGVWVYRPHGLRHTTKR